MHTIGTGDVVLLAILGLGFRHRLDHRCVDIGEGNAVGIGDFTGDIAEFA